MSRHQRRPWWLAGQTVPSSIAATAAFACSTAAVCGLFLADRPSGRTRWGWGPILIQVFAAVLLLFVASMVATIVALRRHPEWSRWPARPMRSVATRVCWSAGSVFALVAAIGLVPAVRSGGGGVGHWQPLTAIAAQLAFVIVGNRTGQRAPAPTNAPPTIT